MNDQRDRFWIRDRRVVVFGIGCALVLFFGDPWHLPPDWGDIPTWLAAVVTTIGGWVALAQLRQQQAVIQGDIDRQAKRDDLLDAQLREAADRARARADRDRVAVPTTIPTRRAAQGAIRSMSASWRATKAGWRGAASTL